MLMAALGHKTNTRPESTIRGDFHDKLRLVVNSMDAKARRSAFRLISKAGDAQGARPPGR